MGEVVTVGLDIAKSVFQVHGVDAEGQVVVQRRLTRAKLVPFFEKQPPCRVGIEACATAHHWGRRLTHHQDRGRGARQQDRPDDLGDHGQRPMRRTDQLSQNSQITLAKRGAVQTWRFEG